MNCLEISHGWYGDSHIWTVVCFSYICDDFMTHPLTSLTLLTSPRPNPPEGPPPLQTGLKGAFLSSVLMYLSPSSCKNAERYFSFLTSLLVVHSNHSFLLEISYDFYYLSILPLFWLVFVDLNYTIRYHLVTPKKSFSSQHTMLSLLIT